MTEWNGSTRITANADVVACEISTGSALLNLETSRYFKLNGTAACLWQALDVNDARTATIDELCGVLAARYEVEADECKADIIAIFRTFGDAGLVAVHGL